jgi:hypothetical protein
MASVENLIDALGNPHDTKTQPRDLKTIGAGRFYHGGQDQTLADAMDGLS